MKYGIIVNGRVTEPVTIPSPLPSRASNPTEFLQKLYADKSGWIEVSGDAVPGTIANGDGTFSAPPSVSSLSGKSDMERVIERLEAIEAALASG